MAQQKRRQGPAEHMLHRNVHEHHQKAHGQPKPFLGCGSLLLIGVLAGCLLGDRLLARPACRTAAVTRLFHRFYDLRIRHIPAKGHAIGHQADGNFLRPQLFYRPLHMGHAGGTGHTGYFKFTLFHWVCVPSSESLPIISPFFSIGKSFLTIFL